jgi:hypothetical protein
LKDVELFLGEASGYALTASSLEWFRPVLERTIAQGLGDSDYSAIFEVVNPIPSPYRPQACYRLPHSIASRRIALLFDIGCE